LRAFGTFDQPNPYAGYLNVTLAFALALGLRHSLSPARFWYRVAAALIAGGILVSGSRGAYLAGMLATVVVLSLAVPWFRVWAWLGVFAGVVGSWLATYNLVPLGPFQRLLATVGVGNVSFTSVNNDNFSAVERAAHWLAGVRMFASHPVLGVGIGNYASAYPNYHPRGWYAPLGHAHNYYINVAAEAGIIGLSAYLLLAGSALWYSYAALRHVPDGVLYAAILGVLGALIATYFHDLFDVLYVHGMAALFGVLVALVPASMAIGQREGLVPLAGKSHRVETLWNRPRGG
jgi:O-antigen ligase